MQAPKPAICGNGHAAMLRTKNVDKHLVIEEKKTINKPTQVSQKQKH